MMMWTWKERKQKMAMHHLLRHSMLLVCLWDCCAQYVACLYRQRGNKELKGVRANLCFVGCTSVLFSGPQTLHTALTYP